MKTFNFLTTRQHAVLADLIAGKPLGYRTVGLTRILNNLKRVGMIDANEDVTPYARKRWQKWQEEQGNDTNQAGPHTQGGLSRQHEHAGLSAQGLHGNRAPDNLAGHD